MIINICLLQLKLIIIRLYCMWWPYPNLVCNSYPFYGFQCSTYTTYPYQPIQPYQTIHSFTQNQQTPINVQKSYRDTLEEIEQKPIKKRTIYKRRKVQKSRFMHKKDKEDNFERKKQKKDRNLPSNICKYFISYLYNHPCPESILKTEKSSETEKLIKSSISQAKTYIKPTQTYIRPGLIEQMCRGDLLDQNQSHIFRILFQRYMKTEFRMLISTIKKLTKKQKICYFKLGRKFVKIFTERR